MTKNRALLTLTGLLMAAAQAMVAAPEIGYLVMRKSPLAGSSALAGGAIGGVWSMVMLPLMNTPKVWYVALGAAIGAL